MVQQENLKWVEVSRSALEHNLGEFRSLVPEETALMAVIKANAYGHGLLEVASVVEEAGADWLGVNELDEALALRQAGSSTPLLVMGAVAPSRAAEVAQNGIRCVVYDKEQVSALNEAGRSVGFKVPLHIKLDTGLSRQGVAPDELLPLARRLASLEWVTLDGLSTHFANIEDTTDHTYARTQLARFREGLTSLDKEGLRPSVAHCACSAASLVMRETGFDLARIGIGLYGLWPSKETQLSVFMRGESRRVSLRPALTWKTKVVQVKNVSRGAPIGYGCTELATHDSTLAILPVGYYDGYDRRLSNQGQVLIRGQRAHLRGRVCMNMVIVDVSHLEGVVPGEEVVLLGAQGTDTISAEFVASQLSTINYEVVTRIASHLPRLIVP